MNYLIRKTTILLLLIICFTGCKSTTVCDGGNITPVNIDSSIAANQMESDLLMKQIDSIAQATGIYENWELRDRSKDVKKQFSWLCRYYNRWKERLVENKESKDLQNKVDSCSTGATNKLLIREKGADTLKRHVNNLNNYMQSIVNESLQVNITVTSTEFKDMPLKKACRLFDVYLNEAAISEVVILKLILVKMQLTRDPKQQYEPYRALFH